jgi:peptide/nickel transport system ATP-binding protein
LNAGSLLSIEGLNIEFGHGEEAFHAVRDLSLDIGRGEIMAIVGESGSGKSVTALSILRLLPPAVARYRGSILFHDRNATSDLLSMPASELRQIRGNRISMIFQEPMTSLNPLLTCGRQVMEVLMLHRGMKSAEARAKTTELFERVRLPDPRGMLSRYPHQLSGGQKQRVMIAMAMSCEPALLIADEPTTALDVTVQHNILQLVRDLRDQQGMAVIFISHDLGLVADFADKVAVMYKGTVVETGTTSEVLSSPSHPYTRALLACRPILHKPGERLPQVADFMGPEQEKM